MSGLPSWQSSIACGIMSDTSPPIDSNNFLHSAGVGRRFDAGSRFTVGFFAYFEGTKAQRIFQEAQKDTM